MKVPPRKDYPDYYDIIKKPIDITKIMNRIEEAKVNVILSFICISNLTKLNSYL